MNSCVKNTWLTKLTFGSRSHRILCAASTMESGQLEFIAETPNWFYYYRDFSSFFSDRARARGMALLKNINLLYEVCLQRSGLPCAWSLLSDLSWVIEHPWNSSQNNPSVAWARPNHRNLIQRTVQWKHNLGFPPLFLKFVKYPQL